MLNFKVDGDKCVECGACVADCPTRIIKMPEGELPQVKKEDEAKCMECQHCFAICPTSALSIFDLDPQKDSVEINASTMPTPASVDTLVRARRSVRKYKQENVDKNLIESMLLSTANCPTAVNNTALNFNVISDIDRMNEIRNSVMSDLVAYREKQELPAAVAYLENSIEPWKKYNVDVIFRTAPHALIVSAPKDVATCTIIDVSIALSYFELLASANGIGTTWCGMMKMSMELFPQYKEMLLPEGAGDYYCMLFGYPDIKFARTVHRDSVAKINYL